jgi:hypothetical protein
MKTLLLFPPASDPAHPPLGIASLAGFLAQRNESVEVLDLNVLSYHYLLSPENVGRCAETIRARIEELETRPRLTPDEAREYRLLAENDLSAGYLQGEVSGALEDLRDSSTYASRARYAQTSALVRRCMELVSAAHYPVRWYPRGFSMSVLPTRSADVLAAASDRRQNLFIPFFESVVADIAGRRPDVAGISVNYYCQLIPAMTLASILRRHLPDTFIVVGGGLLCFFEGKWQALAPFRDLVDAWIPFEGEIPLDALLKTLRRGEPLAGVPGVLRFEGATALFNPPGPPPDPSGLPPPSFDGLPLSAYLTPEPVLPMLTSRGCYWTRCAFCSHYQLFRRRFRMKTADRVLEEMRCLAGRYGARTFYFMDESIPPGTARPLAAQVSRDRLPFQWFGECRFERALDAETLRALHAGGCRMLIFGLESSVPRVLGLMEKGIDPPRAAAVLRDCAAVGIRSFVMFFIGFPTETRAEAEETIRFVEALRGEITHVAFSNFILEQQSPVYRQPARFGITEILPFADEDLKIYSDFRVGEGQSAEEAIAFLEEARERPGIRSLIDLYLISRTHLIFLPPGETEPRRETAARDADLPPPRHLFPVRRPDLVPRTLAFNLDDIRARLAAEGGSDAVVERRPTHYVFSARREKLFDVGEDGLRLLGPCDGRFSLEEILSAVGEPGRGGALNFFAELEEKGVLRWEVRA